MKNSRVFFIFFFVLSNSAFAQIGREFGFFVSDVNGEMEKRLNNKYQSIRFAKTPILLFKDLKEVKVVKSKYGKLGFLFVLKNESLQPPPTLEFFSNVHDES